MASQVAVSAAPYCAKMPASDGRWFEVSTRRPYECTTCDRRAVVAGGSSSDLHDRTTTVGCCECGQLDDVVVARRIDGSAFSPDDDMSGELMPKCRACGADAVIVWTDGDPCPRCGGPLTLSDR